jgi:chromosome segregation protein
LTEAERRREACVRDRSTAETRRTELDRRLAAVRVELERLDGDLALAAERLANANLRRTRAAEERAQMELRSQQARGDQESASTDRHAAAQEHQRIQSELSGRAQAEEEVRHRLAEQRNLVRQLEQELQQQAQTLRSLEGERAALEGELASLRERAAQAGSQRQALESDLASARRRHDLAAERAAGLSQESKSAAADAEHARHLLAETREREAMNRADRRQAEEALAQTTARRHALEELERDRVGLAPAAAALLAARERFGEGVLGPLSDFVSTAREDAELAERLLGDWMHAVLVRDGETVRAIQAWHAEHQPGALVLLPLDSGPLTDGDPQPLDHRLHADGPASDWVRAALAGSEVLDPAGRVLRRASGAIFLSGVGAPSGPLRRRAELSALAHEVERGEAVLVAADAALRATTERLGDREAGLVAATVLAEQSREAERQAFAAREDLERLVGNLAREAGDSAAQFARLTERLATSEQRMKEIDAALVEGDLARSRLDDELGSCRARLTELESAQEAAREQRVHWQVQEAHVAGGLRSAEDRLQRASGSRAEAESEVVALTRELGQLEADTAALALQQAEWQEQRSEREVAARELEAGSADAESELAQTEALLETAEREVAATRTKLESASEESHALQVRLTETAGSRRSIVERVEAEWRRSFDQLLEGATLLDLDLETLETEAGRISEALEAIGPVNPLAVEEHAEEVKRLNFLTGQRDDLVAARQALMQAIREIDGTARSMFLETFAAVQENFGKVFHTLFGGGECELRLANPEDPLESEIDIHAAPRGKRTQRIHLLSSGERTLVAVSLLFSIYLTKPSPFCLMDEVDAPLDDANVGRFTRLLDEFKPSTQFLVITHNPRTMQAADAVYGVTMQEPGVSTIVGVKLGEREHV